MENIDMCKFENWQSLKKLYMSDDKDSWILADTILQQANKAIYKNQIAALIKIIPEGRSEITPNLTWNELINDEITYGSKESVQMLADIYSEYITLILFNDDPVFKKFNIKLFYNG